MIKFGYTILYVANVEATATFYTSLLGFEVKLITPEKDYAELKSGETTLAFANYELGDANFNGNYTKSSLKDKPFGFELAFVTEHVEETMKKALSLGAELVSETTLKPWQQKVGYIRDLNGFLLEICSPMNN